MTDARERGCVVTPVRRVGLAPAAITAIAAALLLSACTVTISRDPGGGNTSGEAVLATPAGGAVDVVLVTATPETAQGGAASLEVPATAEVIEAPTTAMTSGAVIIYSITSTVSPGESLATVPADASEMATRAAADAVAGGQPTPTVALGTSQPSGSTPAATRVVPSPTETATATAEPTATETLVPEPTVAPTSAPVEQPTSQPPPPRD